MPHQPGWQELYGILDQGSQPSHSLVDTCLRSRSGLGETMLHWYAIEGAPHVLERLIALGFEVNVQNEFGNTPLMEASLIGRWDNVRVLLHAGARADIRNGNGDDYVRYMQFYRKKIPAWVRAFLAQQQRPAHRRPRKEP